jgi:O-antigen ligase
MIDHEKSLNPASKFSWESIFQWGAACSIILLIPLSIWQIKFIIFLLLPFLFLGFYLIIKYPAFLFIIFVSAAAREGGFVSEVRSITLTRLSFLLFSLSFVLNLFRISKWRKFNDDPLWILLSLLIICYFLAFFWTTQQDPAMSKLLELLLIILPCAMGYLVFRKATLFEYKMFITVYVIGAIALLIFMYYHISEIIMIAQISERTSQRVSPFNANSYGRVIMVAITALASLSLFSKKQLMLFLLTALFTAAALGMIIVAGSRSSVLIFFVTLFLMFLLHEYLTRFLLLKKYLLYFTLLCIVIGLSFFLIRNYLPENLSYRTFRLFTETSQVIEENPRLELYKKSMDLINDAPFIGNGIRGFYSQMDRYPHNLLIEITLEAGFLSLFLFLCFFLFFVFRTLSVMKMAYKWDKGWFKIFFALFFMTISTWFYTLFIGELVDHRIVFFLMSIFLASDYRIKTALMHRIHKGIL